MSTYLLSFGVRLGMSRDEALKALQGFTSEVAAQPNKEGDIDVIAGSDIVMSVHFDQDQSSVSKIEGYPPMMKFLSGRSRDLLIPAAFTQDSSVRLELLGREDNATHEADSWLKLNRETFVCGKEGLQLEIGVVDLSATHKSITARTIMRITPTRAR